MSDDAGVNIPGDSDSRYEMEKSDIESKLQAALGELGRGLVANVTDYHVEDTPVEGTPETLKTTRAVVELTDPKDTTPMSYNFIVVHNTEAAVGENMIKLLELIANKVQNDHQTPVLNGVIFEGTPSDNKLPRLWDLIDILEPKGGGPLRELQSETRSSGLSIYLNGPSKLETLLTDLLEYFQKMYMLPHIDINWYHIPRPSGSFIGELIANAIHKTLQSGGEEA